MHPSYGYRTNVRPGALSEAEDWNQRHGFGTRVRFWLGAKVGEPYGQGVVYSSAMVIDAVAVVYVVGRTEAIALRLVEVVEG